jgi:LacI family transcriptional regulator
MAQRRVTSHEVAKLAGVSQSTVSIVLTGKQSIRISDATRQRVLQAAHQLGYHPNAAARALVRQQTRTIGLIVRECAEHMRENPFLPAVIEGISSVAEASDFLLLVQPVENARHPDFYMKLVLEGNVDGIIFSPTNLDDRFLIEQHPRNIPTVLWGRLPGIDLPFVDVDNAKAARTAVEHLIAQGHRRIACITVSTVEELASADRLRGYRLALETHGLPFDEAIVRYGNFDEQSGFEAMRSLLAMTHRPSAVFVASDVVAFGALRATRSAGLNVPQDLAVVGFDDIPASKYVSPPLTTVRLPVRELGVIATQMLLEMFQTGNRPDSRLLDTELVIRESCGAGLRIS